MSDITTTQQYWDECEMLVLLKAKALIEPPSVIMDKSIAILEKRTKDFINTAGTISRSVAKPASLWDEINAYRASLQDF